MRNQNSVTKKEFAREILVGVTVVSCLFAIFLFVALQKSTGRSLSPLAYLWPETFAKQEERIPVVVFRTEEDRHQALIDAPIPNAYQVAAKSNATENPETNSNQEDRNRASFVAAPTQAKVSENNIRSGSFPKPEASRKIKDPTVKNEKQFPVSQAGFSEPPSTSKPESDSSSFRNEPRSSPNSFAGKPFRNPVGNAKTRVPSEFKTAPTTKPNPPPLRVQSQRTVVKPSSSAKDQNRKIRLDLALKDSLRIRPEAKDSFWTISAQYYGDGKYFKELAAFNGRSDRTDQLPNPVLVPPLKVLLNLESKKEPALDQQPAGRKPGNTYRTTGDESLFEIAREELGNASRFIEIYKLNRARLPENCDAQTRLKPGLSLLMPGR